MEKPIYLFTFLYNKWNIIDKKRLLEEEKVCLVLGEYCIIMKTGNPSLRLTFGVVAYENIRCRFTSRWIETKYGYA